MQQAPIEGFVLLYPRQTLRYVNARDGGKRCPLCIFTCACLGIQRGRCGGVRRMNPPRHTSEHVVYPQRLGYVVLHTNGQNLFAVTGHRVGRHRDDG